MKSNTEVYSQWLDSKVVLEPTHPPGGQLNSTMMTSFTAAEEQDHLLSARESLNAILPYLSMSDLKLTGYVKWNVPDRSNPPL